MTSRKTLVLSSYMIITLIYMTVTAIVILNQGLKDFVYIIPGRSTTDVIVLFFGVPLLICLPLLCLKFVTVINFKFWRPLQKKYDFYYVDLGKPSFSSRNIIARALLPVFMSISISQLINTIPVLSPLFGSDQTSAIIMLSLIVAPITSLLLLPVWVFKDSGIVRIRISKEKQGPPELSYFGKIQHQSYRGFAGISTPILYFITISSAVNLSGGTGTVIISFIIIFYPIVLVGFFIPLLVLYEKRINKLGQELVKKFNLQPLNLEVLENNIKLN